MDIYVLILLIQLVLILAGMWRIFAKAGMKGFWAIVPFYNIWLAPKLIGKKWYWFVYFLVPFINIYVFILFFVDLVKNFGKRSLWYQVLTALFPFVILPILGFSKKEEYISPENMPEYKVSSARDWADTIIFAVIAATIIRTFFVEPYTIPSSSMEKGLMVGDYLFVTKYGYGARVPQTPISFPLIHNTYPIIGGKSYIDAFHLPYHRLPGYSHIKRGDAVVFNYPDGDTLSTVYQSNESYYSLVRRYGRDKVWEDRADFGDIITRPVDKRENFIKRCIGLPGETIKLDNATVYINGRKIESPENFQLTYRMDIKDGYDFNEKEMVDFGISKEDMNMMRSYWYIMLTKTQIQTLRGNPYVISITPVNTDNGRTDYSLVVDENYKMLTQVFFHPDLSDIPSFLLQAGVDKDIVAKMKNSPTLPLSRTLATKLSKLPYISNVKPVLAMKGYASRDLYPFSSSLNWNVDFYGPVTIPQKGMRIALTDDNIMYYGRCIRIFEGHSLEKHGSQWYIDGKPQKYYTFAMDYYWMQGDNRHNSADSRYWGFVPEDHIVGKASFIWFSWNKDQKGFFKKIRWNRLFTFAR